MPTDLQHYEDTLDQAPIDGESVTYLLAAGATRDEVATALGADLSRPGLDWMAEDVMPDEDTSGYALVEVPGGVIAMEPSGFADPRLQTLRTLSSGGRTAAVARSNILGHMRFGYARNGEIVFDVNEYIFVDDLDDFPAEVRDMAALARDEADALAVAVAMCAQVTGLSFAAADLARAVEDGFFRTPSLVYSKGE